MCRRVRGMECEIDVMWAEPVRVARRTPRARVAVIGSDSEGDVSVSDLTARFRAVTIGAIDWRHC